MCIIPICHALHWTLLIRKFVANSWNIYYIDSMSQGSDQRMRQWRDLFEDDDLFSGSWIKLKIIPQSELECGARVCLHGLCFALSSHNAKEIGRQLQRFSDLAARSRLMVSGNRGGWKLDPSRMAKTNDWDISAYHLNLPPSSVATMETAEGILILI